MMNEGRDLRNKVCFIDDHAYAVGGLNSKAEKFSYKDKKWVPLSEYPLSDNLDSWACALCYIPQEYSNLQMKKNTSVSSGTNEETREFERLLEQEKLIDMEIRQEIDKYKLAKKTKTKSAAMYCEEEEHDNNSPRFAASDDDEDGERGMDFQYN